MRKLIGQRLLKELEGFKPEKPIEIRDTEQKGFILRVQPSGVMTYICEYARGKRITIAKVGAIKPKQAKDRAGDIMAQAKTGNDPIAEKKSEKAITLSAYLKDKYGPWVKSNRKDGEATLARIESCYKEFLNKKLIDLTSWQVEKWRATRLKSGTKPATVNRDLTALKAALSKAVEWGTLDTHPLAKVKPSQVDKSKRIRFLDQEEEKRLREAMAERAERMRQERDSANEWRKARGYAPLPCLRSVAYVDHLEPMVLLSINTGLRRGEVFNLKWSDVDFQRSMLTVEGATAKSGSTRHIPLNSEAASALKEWQEQTGTVGLIFPGKNGKPLNNVKKAWRGLLSDAKISAFRWHDLRHHFASRLVMAGVDLNTVRELLGHSDLKMTLRYAHLAPAHKAAAVAKLLDKDISAHQKVSNAEMV